MFGELELIEHFLTGFEIPVCSKDEVEVVHHRAFDAGHHVYPFAPLAVGGTPQIAWLDQVDRTGHAHPAIDHQDLAVVTQVRAAPTPLERRDRQHAVPLDTRLSEAFLHLPVTGQTPATDLIEEETHLDPASGSPLERLEHRLGVFLINTGDIELDVHVVVGGVDVLGHRLQDVLIVGVEAETVTTSQGVAGQVLVKFGNTRDPAREMAGNSIERVRSDRRHDLPVDGLLAFTPRPVEPVRTEQQEKNQADVGQQEDRKQPRHRGGGAAAPRHNTEHRDTDQQVHREQRVREPLRPIRWQKPDIAHPGVLSRSLLVVAASTGPHVSHLNTNRYV